MRDEKELIDFFLDGDTEKRDELLKILGEIVFQEAPLNGCTINDIDLASDYHKSKIIYYDQLSE